MRPVESANTRVGGCRKFLSIRAGRAARRTLWSVLIASAVFLLSSFLGCGSGGSNGGGATTPSKTATPAFSVAGGIYNSDQSITISCTTPSATIYYTTDSSTPTSASTRYTNVIVISSTTTLKAIATASEHTESTVATAVYTLKAAIPAMSPAAGTYANSQSVAMSSATQGSSIYYTTDGSTPSASSSRYTAAIGVSSSVVLKAIATKSGYSDSDIASSTYMIGDGVPSYTFRNVKITAGGFVTGVIFHPAQQNLIYARTDIGGVYRWHNTDQKWVPILDWIGFDDSDQLGIEAIGLDPSDPQRLYIAAGIYSRDWQGNPINGKMLISTDQGNTFQIIPVSIPMGGNEDGRFAGNRFAVDPNYGQKLYYGSKNTGLWASNDYGLTWNRVTSFPVTTATNGAGIVFVEFVKSSGSNGSPTPIVYMGVSDTTGTYSRLYRSTDSGATWTAVPNQPTALASQFPNHGVFGPDGALYMSFGNGIGPNGMTGGAVWKYEPTAGDANGPGTWTDITPPTLPYEGYNGQGYPHGWGSVAVDPRRPGVIMASTMDLWFYHDGLVRSIDGGETWIDLGETSVRDATAAPYMKWGNESPGVGNWIGSLAIDPYDSDHVLYGWGGGIWTTHEVTKSEPGTPNGSFQVLKGGATQWTMGAEGIEEGATIKLVSPPAGPHLISAMGDFKGFVHTDLTQSPAGGMESPIWTSSRGLDFAEAAPSIIARVGDRDAPPWGSYSVDGGTTWTAFASSPTSSCGGTIAVSADGTTFVWSANILDSNYNVIGGKVAYSKDHGTTWVASTGAPQAAPIYSDRLNSKKFYMLNESNRTLYRSIDGGISFSAVNSALPMQSWSNSDLTVSYAAEGDLWLATDSGLYHSTDSGATFSKISAVQTAYGVGLGKAALGSSYPALYLAGQVNDKKALYRSVDEGQSWIRINDDQHQYGWVSVIVGDPRIFGRVYFGGGGRGIIYGDSTF